MGLAPTWFVPDQSRTSLNFTLRIVLFCSPTLDRAVREESAVVVAKVEGTEADDEDGVVSVGGTPSTIVGDESEGLAFEEAMRKVWLAREIDTISYITGQPLC